MKTLNEYFEARGGLGGYVPPPKGLPHADIAHTELSKAFQGIANELEESFNVAEQLVIKYPNDATVRDLYNKILHTVGRLRTIKL